MSFSLLRKLAVFGVVLFVAPACQKVPTSPTVIGSIGGAESPTPDSTVSVFLSNLSGTYVGLANEICETSDAPVAPLAIDHLSLDYNVSGASLAGARLMACDDSNCESGVPLGTVTECPVPPDPCSVGIRQAIDHGAAPACLIGDPTGSGSLRVFAGRSQDADSSWSVMAYFEGTGNHSNTVSAVVEPGAPQADVNVSDSSMRSPRFARRVRRK